MSRADIQPILEAIPAARQEDARHYWGHPYFTRRPANVVREYLKRYSQSGDTVLDPFGGTGVANGTTSFTSEALFNRLIIEMWQRRALGCLSLDRREFASRLEQRGWSYDAKTHRWSKRGYPRTCFGEMMLFDREAPES